MNTDHVTDELLGYLEGTLSATDRARIGRHLSQCAGCRAEYAALAETYHGLDYALKSAASRAAAPAGAWARFEARLSHQTNTPRPARGRMHTMNTRTKSSRPSPFPTIVFAGAAALTLIVGVLAAYLFLFKGGSGVASVYPPAATQISTAVPSNITPTFDQTRLTQRPQSGGGSGNPEGSSGENLAPVWQGTVHSVDPATRTITLDPDGREVRVMDFTQFIIEDITWTGAKGSLSDIHPGAYIQADLLIDKPPFARIIWLKRTQPGFWEDGTHELHSGVITALDPATGIFSIEPLESGSFQLTVETRILRDTDALDGQPAALADVQLGQSVNFVNSIGGSQPRPVALLMIVPPDPESAWLWYWATVTAVNPTSLVVHSTESADPITLDLGPAGYAQKQGVTFAAGDLVAFRAYLDAGQLVPVELIKLSDGGWLRLRDANGPLWPNP